MSIQWSYEPHTHNAPHQQDPHHSPPDNHRGWCETSHSLSPEHRPAHHSERTMRKSTRWKERGLAKSMQKAQQKGSGLTLFQVMTGVGSPWALHGIWTSFPDSTVMSLGAFVKTGVTDDLKTCVNDYSSQDVHSESYATNTELKIHTTWKSSLLHKELCNLSIMCFMLLLLNKYNFWTASKTETLE